jgi:flagellar FliL protein
MAKEKPETEGKKGSPMKKIIMIALGGVVLLGGGAGAGLYFGGAFDEHKAEKQEDPNRPKLVEKSKEGGEAAAEGGEGGEAKAPPRVGTVYVESDKFKVDPKKFEAAYLPLPESFTSNLSNGDGFVQVGLSVSTYYDDKVFANVQRHMVPIRSAILMVLSMQDGMILSTPEGKNQLQRQLTDAINKVLRDKEGFGGIDNVYFANLVIQ